MTEGTTPKKPFKTSISVDEDLWREFRSKAIANRDTVKSILETAIRDYLKEDRS